MGLQAAMLFLDSCPDPEEQKKVRYFIAVCAWIGKFLFPRFHAEIFQADESISTIYICMDYGIFYNPKKIRLEKRAGEKKAN